MKEILLSCDFAGIKFDNPFIIAASPCSRDSDHVIRAAKNGWGGAVIKTVTNHPPFKKNPRPSLSALRIGESIFGISSNEIYTDLGLDLWCKREIPKIKKVVRDTFVLIGSVMEGPKTTHWGKTCEILEKSGIDAIELNVSCPHGMSQKYMGKFIQDDVDLLYLVMKACKEAVSVPIIVKLNARCVNIENILHACEEAKVDGITATNSLLSIPSVDIGKRRPNPASNGVSTFSGYCGSGIRPIALGFIAEIAQRSRMPLSGVGGIENWENVIEFIMLGASTVQLCSSVMLNGYGIVEEISRGVCQFLESEGFRNINEMRGVALDKLVSSQEIEDLVVGATAFVDMEKCLVCGFCIQSCKNAATNALSIIDNSIIVDNTRCIGCGFCSIVCPNHAIEVK